MSSQKRGSCAIHIEMQVDFICCDCSNLLCMTCYKNHTRSHRIVKLEEYFQDQKPHLVRELKRVQTLRGKLSDLRDSLEICQKQREHVKIDCMDSFESFNTVQKHIDQWKSQLFVDLEEMKQNELQESSSSAEPGVFKKPLILCRKTDISKKVRKLTPTFIAEYQYTKEVDLKSSESYSARSNGKFVSDSGQCTDAVVHKAGKTVDSQQAQLYNIPSQSPVQPLSLSQPKGGKEGSLWSQPSNTDQFLPDGGVYTCLEDEEYYEDPSMVTLNSRSNQMLDPQPDITEKAHVFMKPFSLCTEGATVKHTSKGIDPSVPQKASQPPQLPPLFSQPSPVPLPRRGSVSKKLKSPTSLAIQHPLDKHQLQGGTIEHTFRNADSSISQQALPSSGPFQSPIPLPRRSNVGNRLKSSKSQQSLDEHQQQDTYEELLPRTEKTQPSRTQSVASEEEATYENLLPRTEQTQPSGTQSVASEEEDVYEELSRTEKTQSSGTQSVASEEEVYADVYEELSRTEKSQPSQTQSVASEKEEVYLTSCEAYNTESILSVVSGPAEHTHKNVSPIVSRQLPDLPRAQPPKPKPKPRQGSEESLYRQSVNIDHIYDYIPGADFEKKSLETSGATETDIYEVLPEYQTFIPQPGIPVIPVEKNSPKVLHSSGKFTQPSCQKSVVLEPCSTIVNGVFAKFEGEEVRFDNVCTNSRGCIILSDSLNLCLRVLEGIGKRSSKRITIPLNGPPKALAFSQAHGNKFKNGAVLVAGNFHDCNMKKVKLTEAFTYKIKNLKSKVVPTALACGDCDRSRSTSDCSFALITGQSHASIHCLNCSGAFNGTLGTDEIGKNPFGMDYHNNYLVVCDREAGCLAKISSKGQALWAESVEARQRGVLKKPHGVAILPMEYIAVSDTETHSISIFSEDGNLELVFGRKGRGLGEFLNPTGLAVRLLEELVVLDSGNQRIQVYQLSQILDELDNYTAV